MANPRERAYKHLTDLRGHDPLNPEGLKSMRQVQRGYYPILFEGCVFWSDSDERGQVQGPTLFEYLDKDLTILASNEQIDARGRVKRKKGKKQEELFEIATIEFARTPGDFSLQYAEDLAEDEADEAREEAAAQVPPPEESPLTPEELRRIAPVLRKWLRGLIARREYKKRIGQAEVIGKFPLSGDKDGLFVLIQRFVKPVERFRFVVFNTFNKLKRDDV